MIWVLAFVAFSACCTAVLLAVALREEHNAVLALEAQLYAPD